ncbi:MAG: YabP/YqfC family sporulation protein [Clostridia bacterium]|nr:YabP/YqfC family sporulation protein [Clostridia bacterium]
MRRIKLGRRISRAMDFPEELLSSEPCVKVFAGEMAVIYGQRAVLECLPGSVHLLTENGDIRLLGEKMHIMAVEGSIAHIGGKVTRVELHYDGEDG